MIKSILIVFLLSFVSCSHKQHSKANTEFKKKLTLPEWISKTQEYCPQDKLCAVGNANDLVAANASARSNIMKIFQVKIKSEFEEKISTSFNQESKYAKEIVFETSSGKISGVEITKNWSDGNEYYSLAVLDKNKAIRKLESENESIENELSEVMQLNDLGAVFKLRELLKKRLEIESYLSILDEYLFEMKYKNSEINQKINKILKNNTLSLNVIDKEKIGLFEFLSKILNKNGIQVVNGQKSQSTVSGKINLKKSYLNVSGFEKYEVKLFLKVINNITMNQTGSLKKVFVITGRDINQIRSKLKPILNKYIDININKLLQK